MRSLILLSTLALASPASAAVIVVANYTPAEVSFTLAEESSKPRKYTLPAHHVMPFTVTGPADLTLVTEAKPGPLRVDPYHGYVLIPDRVAGVQLHGIEMPGKAPDRDAKPELKPLPRDPVKLPVTLLVDDADPRVDELWQTETRKRFDAAAGVIEKQTGFRLEFAGFGTWESNPKGKRVEDQLAAFEGTVKVKAGALAVGFTSRKLDDVKDTAFGACRGLGASHVLVREWRPKGEWERVEVLVRYLATALGAVTSPDTGSAMRPQLGDGQANLQEFVIRLDPLNALALNLWADIRRQNLGVNFATLGDADRTRLARVYGAMSTAVPGDALAAEYLRGLKKDQGDVAGPAPKRAVMPAGDRGRRTDAARAVVRAITERARANTGPGALTGDALTTELLRAAADAALTADEVDRVSVFLLGVGIGLDDGAVLRDNPITAANVRDIETDAERNERLAVLGNPTMRNRRDLCRRFAAGCGAGELLTPSAAENAAVGSVLFGLHRPSGFSFPALSAEFAGVSFARTLQRDPRLLRRISDRLSPSDLIPDTAGLRDGLDADKFEDTFGGAADDRFRRVLDDIRRRVKELPVNRAP
jgi:hypothetical protein